MLIGEGISFSIFSSYKRGSFQLLVDCGLSTVVKFIDGVSTSAAFGTNTLPH